MRTTSYLVLLALVGCGAPNESADAPPPPDPNIAELSAESVALADFGLHAVSTTAWTSQVSGPARIALDPSFTESIGSIVEGRVMKAYVMPGDRVGAGQVLYAIHSHELMDARADMDKASAGLTSAEAQRRMAVSAAERAQRLFDIKALSTADLERAQAARAEAEAMAVSAKAEMVRSEAMIEHLVGHDALPTDYDEHWVLVRAPFAAQVVSRQAEPGNVVLPGDPLLTLSRASALILIVHLPDNAFSSVAPGSAVQFTTTAVPGEVFSARVSRVLPSIDSISRTIEIHATINETARRQLRAELYAQADIQTATRDMTLSVPAGAIQLFEGDTIVVIARSREGGLAIEARKVRVGRTTRNASEILSGLQPGDTIIARGAAIAKAEILKRRGGGMED